MPLTPSHAAAALPLRRLLPRLPLAALVIGTLSPDFEYLVRLAPRGSFAHSLPGLVLFCLPASLIVWIAYRAWIRPATLSLLPTGLAADLELKRRASISAVIAAILLGALSHVVWDAFTHAHGLAVLHLPALRAPVAARSIPGLRWYTVLQHGSTLLGGSVLLWGALSWVRAHPPAARRFAPGQASRSARVVVLLFGIAVLAAVLNGARGLDRGVAATLGFAAVGAMVGVALALLVYSIYVRTRAA